MGAIIDLAVSLGQCSGSLLVQAAAAVFEHSFKIFYVLGSVHAAAEAELPR